MDLGLLCASLIAILFGVVMAFAGYRFFLVLLPVFGFFFGFALGAQAVQAVLGDAFFGTVTSWVVGFVMALIFAVLSYLFYIVGVAILAGGLGYGLGAGLMNAIGFDTGLLTFLAGIALAIVLIFLTLRYNLAKYVIIIGTALGGAAIAIGTLSVGIGGVSLARLSENPVQALFEGSPIWAILFVLMAIGGVIIQWQAGRQWMAEPYPNRI